MRIVWRFAVDEAPLQTKLARCDPRNIEQVVDQLCLPAGALPDPLHGPIAERIVVAFGLPLGDESIDLRLGDSAGQERRRRIQRRCLQCEEEASPVSDQGTVRRTVAEPVQQRAPAPATEEV